MDIKEFSKSNKITAGLIVLAVVVLLCAAFSFGESIGYHKASFAFQNGNNFYRTFGPPHGMMGGMPAFSGDHGTAGKIISINLPAITIEDRDNTEKTVMVNSQTIVRELRNTITADNLVTGEYIVAIGEPNSQSQIVANLIRILPVPPQQ